MDINLAKFILILNSEILNYNVLRGRSVEAAAFVIDTITCSGINFPDAVSIHFQKSNFGVSYTRGVKVP